MTAGGWIGVELDGCLAYDSRGQGVHVIGAPVPTMTHDVLTWIAEGKDVRIVTSRVTGDDTGSYTAKSFIRRWCVTNLGRELPVVAFKGLQLSDGIVALWDALLIPTRESLGLRAGESRHVDHLIASLRLLHTNRRALADAARSAIRGP